METILRSKDGSAHDTNERINTITHLVAACLAVLGAALLIAQASAQGKPWKIVSLSIYGLALASLFIASTLHHGLNRSPKINRILQTIDYSAVFFLIAGTVTPIVLVLYRNLFGWTVLGVIWAIAAFGIIMRSVFSQLPKYVTNSLYIILGWIPIVLIGEKSSLPLGALLLLGLGGITYTTGFFIYIIERPNLKRGIFGFHELWHCLVIVAATMQYFMIYFYVLPKW
jgi:hemolysin III